MTVSNSRALKAYRRFSDTCKAMVAGYSAILFFVNDKIDNHWVRIPESLAAIIGIGLTTVAMVSFNKEADRLEEVSENLDEASGRLKRWREEKIDFDKGEQTLFKAMIVLLITLAIIFTFNPLLDKADKKDNQPILNIVNNKSTKTIDTCLLKPNLPKVKHCRPSCKKAIKQGTCSCR
jgi:hypothetical protein